MPAIPTIRGRLIGLVGLRAYLIAYSAASVLSLGWVFYAALQLDYVELWAPAGWQAWVPLILSPIALFLLLAGLLSANPASITLLPREREPGAIVAVTRHPVLWGFFLWAASHVVANGDLRSLLLFSSMTAFAVFGVAMTEKRARRRLGPAWPPLAKTTSILPFAAILGGRARLGFDRALAIALAVSAWLTLWLLLGGHAALFGADPLAMAQI